MQRPRGLLVVISAPSGGGKTTVIRRLLEKRPEFKYSISATTRPPRKNERHGVDYYFYNEEEFKRMLREDAFLEWAIVHDHYYGTPRQPIEEALRAGEVVLMDIDVQGGLQVKKQCPEDALLIFIMPPSLKVLESRLRGRKTDREEEVERRLAVATHEIEQSHFYDAVVVNRELEETVARVEQIIEKTLREKNRRTVLS